MAVRTTHTRESYAQLDGHIESYAQLVGHTEPLQKAGRGQDKRPAPTTHSALTNVRSNVRDAPFGAPLVRSLLLDRSFRFGRDVLCERLARSVRDRLGNDPSRVLRFGRARMVLAKVIAKNLRVDADFRGKNLRRVRFRCSHFNHHLSFAVHVHRVHYVHERSCEDFVNVCSYVRERSFVRLCIKFVFSIKLTNSVNNHPPCRRAKEECGVVVFAHERSEKTARFLVGIRPRMRTYAYR